MLLTAAALLDNQIIMWWKYFLLLLLLVPLMSTLPMWISPFEELSSTFESTQIFCLKIYKVARTRIDEDGEEDEEVAQLVIAESNFLKCKLYTIINFIAFKQSTKEKRSEWMAWTKSGKEKKNIIIDSNGHSRHVCVRACVDALRFSAISKFSSFSNIQTRFSAEKLSCECH